MTYIQLLNLFWSMSQERPFTTAETTLYFLLLHLYNGHRRQGTMVLTLQYLAQQLAISRNTVNRARLGLEARGLITCTPTSPRGQWLVAINASPAESTSQQQSQQPQQQPQQPQQQPQQPQQQPQQPRQQPQQPQKPQLLLSRYLSEELRGAREQLCMAYKVSPELLEQCAREVTAEWTLQGDPCTDPLAFRRFSNHVAAKARYCRDHPARRTREVAAAELHAFMAETVDRLMANASQSPLNASNPAFQPSESYLSLCS